MTGELPQPSPGALATYLWEGPEVMNSTAR